MVEIPNTQQIKGNNMTFAEAKQKAREDRLAQQSTDVEALASNQKYINYVLDLEDEAQAVTKLDQIIKKVNTIETIVTNDGSKYAVNCYSLPEYIFGPIASRLLALIHIAPSMFTDIRKVEFSAITGIDHLAFNKAATALGTPAYYNKGIVVEAKPSDLEELNLAITYICTELAIPITTITQDQLTRWFLQAELKAETKMEAMTKAELLDMNSEFTIED